MSTFVITRRADGEYQFNLLAGNHEVILTSEGYSSKANCEKGIHSVRENSTRNEAFVTLISSNGKPYFNLVAKNGQVIATSQMYASAASMEKGMEAVAREASEASVTEK